VSWRTSDRHVGWAPLPPEARFERRTGIKRWADSYYDIDVDEYVFIPNEEIGSNNISRAVVPVERNVTIVNQTTNVTNITYNNTTIVNEGPNYDQLSGRSREPLRRMRIERQYDFDEGETPRASVTGEVIAMMAPLFTARAVQKPQTVGAPIQQRASERGAETTGANQAEVERARAKMRAEATPPPDAPPKTFDKPVVAEGTPAPEPAATPTPAATTIASPAATATPTPSATATPTATATATPTASVTQQRRRRVHPRRLLRRRVQQRLRPQRPRRPRSQPRRQHQRQWRRQHPLRRQQRRQHRHPWQRQCRPPRSRWRNRRRPPSHHEHAPRPHRLRRRPLHRTLMLKPTKMLNLRIPRPRMAR
jgi:hypothetical protein